jgi:SAM-dependent methyltransferase
VGSKSTAYWNEIADGWSEVQPQRLWRAYSDLVNGQLLEAWVGQEPVERALKTDCFDEAVGETGLYPKLALAAKAVVGIDLSLATLRRARERHEGLRVTSTDVCRLPFASESFDLVFSNSTLDHMDSLDDVATGLSELHRVLKPGGRLVVTLDNLRNPVVALRNALPQGLLTRIGLVPYHMGASCGPRRLERLVRDAGFEPEPVSSYAHCPRLPAIAVASLLDRRGSARGREAFLRFLVSWEELGRWSTRYLTGYFISVAAIRR